MNKISLILETLFAVLILGLAMAGLGTIVSGIAMLLGGCYTICTAACVTQKRDPWIHDPDFMRRVRIFTNPKQAPSHLMSVITWVAAAALLSNPFIVLVPILHIAYFVSAERLIKAVDND